MRYRVLSSRVSGCQVGDVVDESDLVGVSIEALVRSGLLAVSAPPRSKTSTKKAAVGDDEGTDD